MPPGLRDPSLALRSPISCYSPIAPLAAIRAEVSNARVGISLNLARCTPRRGRRGHRGGAPRRRLLSTAGTLDPLSGRGYPSDMVDWYGGLLDQDAVAEMRTYRGDLDFLGINYYSRQFVRAAPAELLASQQVPVRDASYTNTGWEVYPQGLSEILERVARDYQPKAIYITENGASFDDNRQNGSVPDPARTRYLAAHFAEAARAIAAGVPLEGYFIWSLMDNFEWHNGYTKRFGIVYVDYATQQRIDKGSARWYREFLSAR